MVIIQYHGGALELKNSAAHVNTSGIEFYDNRASRYYGGAIYFTYATIIIIKSVNFIMNSAVVKGGAIFIETGVQCSIYVGSHSLFFNNSAFQEGAFYS